MEKGFLLLNKASRAEVAEFIRTQQHKNGAFTDRAGSPDLYYSLFGCWLSKGLKLNEQLTKLSQHISTFQHDEKKVIDKFSWLLILLSLEEEKFQKPSFFELLRWLSKSGKNVNTAYRFFLFVLSFDALFGKNSVVYFFVRIFLKFYKLPEDLPCSFSAALLMAKFLTGKNVKHEAENLLHYFEKGEGFKVFPEQPNADLLSTAVALFTLKTIGQDLRVLAPDCLDLVQGNYENGAFLSGDGDSSRDLEYTFYGLLTLGALSKNEH
ncbi:prenyltransferase/squalene oxidase repeat-containing protein [Maribellus maritimus]|uniref:prenyltransferase/squalene oxidase repeat-containing protein n=1 Tax=Maribellus maritimus TaxID=2870838 RepID=UPI001EEA47A9|nr:prenyltransferase/squalene oxidase repeat-containing protein [Maribellus maritimus]MCG6185863.1 hypothetical protein [Maribellus maritimus]